MKCRFAEFRRFVFRVVWLLVLLGVAGCGKKEEAAGGGLPKAAPGAEVKPGGGSQGSGAGSPRVEVPAAAPAPAPKALPAKPSLTLSSELESATVVVRVTVAQTLVREHTGVLLQPESFAQKPVPGESLRRLVAVLLPTYDEATLRDPGCTLQVLRQKLDADDKPYVLQCPAGLAHFDAKSRAAVLQYSEDFAYRLDAGLTPGPETSAGATGLHLLTASFSPPPPRALALMREPRLKYMPGTNTLARGKAVNGTLGVALLPARLQQGMLRLEPEEAAAAAGARVAVVLDAQGRLVGHASRKTTGEEAWALQPAAVPAAAEELRLVYVPQSVDPGVVEREPGRPGICHVKVKGLLKDPMREFFSARVGIQLLPTPSFPAVADVTQNQPPIAAGAERHMSSAMAADGSMEFQLRLPENAKSSYHLVQVQLVKKGGSWDGQSDFNAAPFLIVSETGLKGERPKVLGLGGQPGAGAGGGAGGGNAVAENGMNGNAVAGNTMSAGGVAATGGVPGTAPGAGAVAPGAGGAGPVVGTVRKTLSTESPILHGVPICEGRELLLRLEGAPYWKRLSLTDGKWLPLPVAEDEAALCHLTGNREAIFVLHPGRREIRRHHAGTLALEKKEMLPDGMSYQGVAAGCLTASGPVAVMTAAGALACDPHELRVRPTPNVLNQRETALPPTLFYNAAGDGGAVWGISHGKNTESDQHRVWHYEDEVVGFSPTLYWGRHEQGQLPTMAATAPWDRKITGTDVCGSLCNSPNFFLLTGKVSEPAPRNAPTPRCTLYSCYAADPWAAVELPETRDVPPGDWRTFTHRLWLDTESLTLAVWHGRQEITLHTLDKAALPQPPVPVLLNYPDCDVPRGGSFRFTPRMLGGGPREVALSTPPEGMAAEAGGTVQWQAGKDLLPQQVTFGLKLAAPAQAQGQAPAQPQPQRACELQVRLRLSGQKPLVAGPASLSGAATEKAVEEMAHGRKPGLPLVPLSFRQFFSSSPIDRVQELNDYLALHLHNRTLLLLSVKDWQVAGSRTLAETDCAFMAGDAIFIYNTDTRVLSRHSLPGFAVTGRVPMPGNARLFGLGTGTTPEGPLTLLRVENVRLNQPGYAADFKVDRTFVSIVDKQTLAPGRWAPYRYVEKPGRWTSIVEGVHPEKRPVYIPCSQDGRVLNFPNGMIMISPGITVDFNYHRNPQDVQDSNIWRYDLRLGSEKNPVAIASPKGGRMYASGMVFYNNYHAFKVAETSRYHGISSCGNYIATLKTDISHTVPESGQEITLYSAADARPLLNIGGLDLLRVRDDKNPHDTGIADERPLVTPMGDKNLLVLLSRGGTVLEGVDFDFERVCRMVNPATACTTSHPAPVVAEGRTLEYQVTVNNPDAVSGYELQDTTQGATITPQGLLTFQAPDDLEKSQQLKISIRIRFTNGETAVQTFPLCIIALKAEAAAARKAQQEKDAAMGIKKA
ncbi:hypothetical protein [Prosthecobacter sp.]|uniref:hypothetical protein n=1 Tax=Prosthecobacter sp. TaxID=1965333 RepID=UPI003782E931